MKLNDTLKVLMILLMSAGLATTTLTACGGEDEPADVDVEEDAGDEDTGGDPDAGDTGADADADPDPIQVDIVPPPAKCGEEGASDRCDEDPLTFEFNSASKIDTLAIADANCCFDFNEDTFVDNALVGIAGLAGGTDSLNTTIEESIADGTINLILEHDGLEAIAVGQTFDINFLLGGETTPEGVLIDPVSFDAGVAPQALLPNAEIVDDGGVPVVKAGPGTVVIVLELFGLEISVAVRNAIIEADVVVDESSLEGGVTLENGRLGGLILFEELVEAINRVTATCDCLGNPEQLIDLEAQANGDPLCPEYTEAELDANCVDDESICGDIAGYCPALPLALGFADIDIDGDGEEDAFSAGLTFSAIPAVIAGVEVEVAE